MYWLSYVVIAIIVIGLLVAYKTDFYLAQILLIQNLLIFMIVNIPSIAYPSLAYTVINDLAGRAIYLQTFENLHSFITLMYLHASFMHIIGNILVLFFIGVALEDRIGKKWTVLIYFPAGMIATLGQYSIIWGSEIPNLGASGAVMGLMGAIVYMYPKDKIPMFLGPIFMPEVRVDLAVGVFIMMQVGIAIFAGDSNVAHAAHFTGFGAGMLIGAYIKKYRKVDKQKGTKDYTKLKKLVDDGETKSIYDKIEEADTEDVKEAWAQHLLEKARCPRCNRKLKGSTCECGYDVWKDKKE